MTRRDQRLRPRSDRSEDRPREESDSVVLMYTRELPGGGLVVIETVREHDHTFTGRVAVERRCEAERRDGHEPPVIAEVRRPAQADVLRELYPIASDNVAVARGLIQWQAQRRAD